MDYLLTLKLREEEHLLKRTGEITLTVIGAFLNLIGIGVFGFITVFSHTDFFRLSFSEGFNEGMAEDGMEGAIDATVVLNFLSGIGWALSLLSLLGLVAGIIAIIFFKGNKRPKAASIILIITSAIIVLGTIGMGFFAFLCYLIAGIMGLVRKPPHVETEETETILDAN